MVNRIALVVRGILPMNLKCSGEEARLLAMVKPAGANESEGQEVLRHRVPAGGGVLVPDEPIEPVGMGVGDSENNIGRGRTLSRRDDGSEWVIISGGEFFGRTVKAGSIRAEIEDLALADLGLQVVTCQRMKKELVEGILESLCDTWRETLGRRHQRDMGRILSDSLGAAPVVGGGGIHLRADDGDLSVHEHELLCLTLGISGCYDQLDLSALAGMERVSRRLQLIKESKTADGAAAYEGAKIFVGYRRRGALVAPELGRHVAHKLQEELIVMKKRRKHAEERGSARGPPAKGGKTT